MSSTFQPQQFGRYYLVDRIAVGGMAEVFKARTFADGGFQKLLVIKRILQHLSGNDEFIEMFIDEAKISVELQHPNIVQIYDFGKIGDEYFLAMECVEGKDVKGILRKLAERRKVMPTEYAVYIAHEMCKGLDFAHKKTDLHGEHLGIVHRDISPSNIIVSYNGEVKIADFGIAKAEISLYNTKDGVLKGKFEYMSPEQASGERVTARSDIFATGIILHEMLTGRRLFKTDSDIKTLNRIKAADVQPPSELNPAVPTRLDEIVMRALSRDPADRYPDARAFQAALLEYMYPSTPDVIRESLKRFQHEVFTEEITTEVERLRAGSQAAAEMWEKEPELDIDPEWEDAGASARTLQTRPSRMPYFMAGGAVLLALAVTAGSFLVRPEPEVVEVPAEVTAPTTGALQLRVEPAEATARVLVDGRPVAEGSGLLLLEDLAPGAGLSVRVEAEGFEPYEDTIDILAGERLRLPVRLAPVAEPAPVEEAPEEPPPKAPEPRQAAAKPDPKPEARPEPPKPAAPGKVNVNVRGSWAEVWIDGQKVDTTPLVGHELPAGSHTIRVVNAQAGVDATKTVTVASGELTKVVF